MQMGARYYDPTTGSFLTRDTDLSQLSYVYCGDDPINKLDPSGHDWRVIAGGIVGGIGGGVIGFIGGGGIPGAIIGARWGFTGGSLIVAGTEEALYWYDSALWGKGADRITNQIEQYELEHGVANFELQGAYYNWIKNNAMPTMGDVTKHAFNDELQHAQAGMSPQ